MSEFLDVPDLHVIPKGEEHLHKEDINCPCEPVARVDVETGVLGWIHKQYLAFANIFKI